MWHELFIDKLVPQYGWGDQPPDVYASREPLVDDLDPCTCPSNIYAPLSCWMIKLPANEQHCKIHSPHCKHNVENLIAVGGVLFQLYFIIPKLERFGVDSSRKRGHYNGTNCDNEANNSSWITIISNFHMRVALPSLWLTVECRPTKEDNIGTHDSRREKTLVNLGVQ